MHISFKFPFKGYENINCGLTHIFSFNQKNMKKYEKILAKKITTIMHIPSTI